MRSFFFKGYEGLNFCMVGIGDFVGGVEKFILFLFFIFVKRGCLLIVVFLIICFFLMVVYGV